MLKLKGYKVANGKVSIELLKNGRAVGTIILANGEFAEINVSVDQAKLVDFKKAVKLLDKLDFATSVGTSVKEDSMIIWCNGYRWQVTDLENTPIKVPGYFL